MTNHEKIIELNKIWYDLIGGDHHKDRDCHFRICTHYMYGDKFEYEVEHHGYILDRIEEDFKTLEEAENFLIRKVLKKGIMSEINWFLNPPDDCIVYGHDFFSKEKIEELKKRTLELVPGTEEDEKEEY